MTNLVNLVNVLAAALLTLVPSALAQAPTPVTIDGRNSGRTFDGIGGVSAGASTRLLYDYPEPQRSQILDYLFKPNYGSAHQVLKVEIGGDMNATCGSEPSHMRTPTDLDCNRGYEWWLMHEARKRNPDIILAALEWGAPGWFDGGFWSQDNVDYIIKWLDCAQQQGLKIDYVGGWNEKGYEARWFVLLDHALKEHHPDVRIIAPDDLPHHNWRIAQDMAADLEVNAAIDVLGQHSPGTWRSLYAKYSATPEALRLGKPLWASEQSSLSHDVGGRAWARGLNRAYIDARITATLNWAPVSAWYSNIQIADTGLILAEWPWSGYYSLGSTVWVYAHTTQFAQPGWNYIDSACGYLDSGASYVTFKSPDGQDFSTVIETLDAKEISHVQFTIAGGLNASTINLWRTDPVSLDPADHFIQLDPITTHNGVFTVALDPGRLYSLTTTTGQSKGDAAPDADVYQQMPLPHAEDFENYQPGDTARFYADMNGAFEVQPAIDRPGLAYAQVVPQEPIAWGEPGRLPTTTMVGDPRWWGDYEIATDVYLPQPGHVLLMGRVSARHRTQFAGYHLQVDTDGHWKLYRQHILAIDEGKDVELASGQADFPTGQWHRVALRMNGTRLEALLNGHTLGAATDDHFRTGNASIRVAPWQPAQIDNVNITPTGPAPDFIPQRQLTATATSQRSWYHGDAFFPDYAIDGRPESHWLSAADTPLPQAITIDLGHIRDDVQALTCQPRIDGSPNGLITRYRILTSLDGQTFHQLATGQWPLSTGTKIANFPPTPTRYVRLEALDAQNNAATAGELNLATSPIPQ